MPNSSGTASSVAGAAWVTQRRASSPPVTEGSPAVASDRCSAAKVARASAFDARGGTVAHARHWAMNRSMASRRPRGM